MIRNIAISKYFNTLVNSAKNPQFISGIKIMTLGEFNLIIKSSKKSLQLSKMLGKGNFVLIKKCIKQKDINSLISTCLRLEKNTKQSFFKLDKKIPNFWRRITEKKSRKYSLLTDRTSWYFFRWNKNSENIYKVFNSIWRKVKYISGLKSLEFEKLLPSDKSRIDRIQIVRYPDKSGFIEQHTHPVRTLRVAVSVYMSTKGVDYVGGGTYFVKKNRKKIYPENFIEAGDVGLFFTSLIHGVDKFKVKKTTNKKKDGRWWLGLYSPESDLTTNRVTSLKNKI